MYSIVMHCASALSIKIHEKFIQTSVVGDHMNYVLTSYYLWDLKVNVYIIMHMCIIICDND